MKVLKEKHVVMLFKLYAKKSQLTGFKKNDFLRTLKHYPDF